MSLPDSLEQDDLLVGRIFEDRFEILSVLGQGGGGVVYKAKHTHMDKLVAIKMLVSSLVRDEESFLRFKQEAKAAAALEHQNIITIHDFGKSVDGQAYLVMEYLAGQSLDDLFKREQRLDVDRFVTIFGQVCDGLQHAHKKGVVHRDVKPSNIMLVDRGESFDLAKVVDFGLAKLTAQETEQDLTKSGVVMGTPLYMSPEQCRGGTIDYRSDIYSLGCVMYAAITGQVPHKGDSTLSTLFKHMSEVPQSFSVIASDVNLPPGLEAVIFKALEKDPNARQQSMSELRNGISDAVYKWHHPTKPGDSRNTVSSASKPGNSVNTPRTPSRAGEGVDTVAAGIQENDFSSSSSTSRTDPHTAKIAMPPHGRSADSMHSTTQFSRTNSKPLGEEDKSSSKMRKMTPVLIGGGIAGLAAVALTFNVLSGSHSKIGEGQLANNSAEERKNEAEPSASTIEKSASTKKAQKSEPTGSTNGKSGSTYKEKKSEPENSVDKADSSKPRNVAGTSVIGAEAESANNNNNNNNNNNKGILASEVTHKSQKKEERETAAAQSPVEKHHVRNATKNSLDPNNDIAFLPPPAPKIPSIANDSKKEILDEAHMIQRQANDEFNSGNVGAAMSDFSKCMSLETRAWGPGDPHLFATKANMIGCLLRIHNVPQLKVQLQENLEIFSNNDPAVIALVARSKDPLSIWRTMARSCRVIATESSGGNANAYFGWSSDFYQLAMNAWRGAPNGPELIELVKERADLLAAKRQRALDMLPDPLGLRPRTFQAAMPIQPPPQAPKRAKKRLGKGIREY